MALDGVCHDQDVDRPSNAEAQSYVRKLGRDLPEPRETEYIFAAMESSVAMATKNGQVVSTAVEEEQVMKSTAVKGGPIKVSASDDLVVEGPESEEAVLKDVAASCM